MYLKAWSCSVVPSYCTTTFPSIIELWSGINEPVDGIEPPELKDGDRAPFQQMTFTLHDEQAEEINAAIAKAKGEGGGQSAVNENSNGNALYFIAQRFNRG